MNKGSVKSGALTQEELLQIWSTVAVDERTYAAPLLSLGEGFGLEFHTQVLAQLARVSFAVNTCTQACFILTHSLQSGVPASGESYATVTVSVSRTNIQAPVTLVPKHVWFYEVQNDSDTDGPIPVTTGRRYTPIAVTTLAPGEAGPVSVLCVAERPGYGYNNPLPGTISSTPTPGYFLQNTGASLAVTDTSQLTLTLAINPDVLTPSQIGEYVVFTSGANLGKIARITSYAAPNVGVDGGAVTLAIEYSAQSSTFSGTLTPGQNALLYAPDGVTVLGGATIVSGRLGSDGTYRVTYIVNYGVHAPVLGYVGTMRVTLATYTPAWSAAASVGWRVFQWEFDHGISVSNNASPVGGAAGALDLLGSERLVYRAPNEGDASYRARVAQVADVVSPNAILRGANGILHPYGVDATLREVGSAQLPGLYYDAGSSSDTTQDSRRNFAYDMDPTLRPDDMWKCYFSFAEMRAFFLLGLPDVSLTVTSGVYSAIYNVTDSRRAGGVDFVLYQTNVGI